jgi:hypothetical protein
VSHQQDGKALECSSDTIAWLKKKQVYRLGFEQIVLGDSHMFLSQNTDPSDSMISKATVGVQQKHMKLRG